MLRYDRFLLFSIYLFLILFLKEYHFGIYRLCSISLGDLVCIVVFIIVLYDTILGAVAKMERGLTVERVREGIRKAQQYGTRSGRPIGRSPRKIPASFKKYYEMWKNEETTGVEFARLLNVSRPTLYRYVGEYEQ